jgi:hypothetical protein
MNEQPTNKPTKWDEFDVDASIAFSEPLIFARSVAAKAAEIKAQLNATSTINSLNSKFRAVAEKNVEAKQLADELISEFLDKLSEQTPEVLVHILPRLAEIAEFCDGTIRHESMRSRMNNGFSKKRLHQMYIKLRKMYEQYCQAMEAFANAKFPMIPALSGNYNDTTKLPEFIFQVDDEVIMNYYHAARLCEFEANSYMDVVERFTDVTEINGHKVKMVEL